MRKQKLRDVDIFDLSRVFVIRHACLKSQGSEIPTIFVKFYESTL